MLENALQYNTFTVSICVENKSTPFFLFVFKTKMEQSHNKSSYQNCAFTAADFGFLELQRMLDKSKHHTEEHSELHRFTCTKNESNVL